MTTGKKIAASFIIAGIMAIIGALLVYNYYLAQLSPFPAAQETASSSVRVEIAPGSSGKQIGQQLESAGVIKSGLAFELYIRQSGAGAKLQAGKYDFTPGAGVKAAVLQMVAGDTVDEGITVTIPEGYTLKQMADKFAEAGLFSADDFLKAASETKPNYSYLQASNPGVKYPLEGFLFPDTYEFLPGTSPQEVIIRMAARFNEVLTSILPGKLPDGVTNVRDLVTLASIIEREGMVDIERPTIAGVFVNRLRVGMALQSCATVQYVLPVWKPVLDIPDTEIDSVYNTYKNPGLPPGPIGAPGLASLKAAANPEKTDYFYFVAKGDGTHIFSRTFAEHQRAIDSLR
jgi:UPF0755 protein